MSDGTSTELPDGLLRELGRLATSAAALELLVRSASHADVDDRQLTLWRYTGTRAVAESHRVLVLVASSAGDELARLERLAEQALDRVASVARMGRSIGVRIDPVLVPRVA